MHRCLGRSGFFPRRVATRSPRFGFYVYDCSECLLRMSAGTIESRFDFASIPPSRRPPRPFRVRETRIARIDLRFRPCAD